MAISVSHFEPNIGKASYIYILYEEFHFTNSKLQYFWIDNFKFKQKFLM